MILRTRDIIEQIRRGNVPDGYKKTKAGILPADWDVYMLGDCLSRVERPVEVKPNELYTQIGIRSHGKGLFYGNTAQIAYRESHSKLVCRAASIIPSVRLAGRINSGCQAGPVSQDQVRQSEQHIQFSGLLPQAPVPCLSVSEPTLDDRKYVFHFSANR